MTVIPFPKPAAPSPQFSIVEVDKIRRSFARLLLTRGIRVEWIGDDNGDVLRLLRSDGVTLYKFGKECGVFYVFDRRAGSFTTSHNLDELLGGLDEAV